ncbi:MAG TPA: hypothetical protein PLN21_03345 [Gemmatales bacterium]|nr:hypothetical protein [Gemmatales bacterium]
MKYWFFSVIIGACCLCSPALARACDFCTNQGPPLTKEINAANLVVFGKITDARLGPDGIKGSSEFSVETVLHGERNSIKGGKIVLPRYVPPVPGVKYVIFLDVSQGQFDPYRSIVCSSDRLVQYVQKMPALTGAGTPAERQARLKFVFDYFQDAEPELAADAYKEWAIASNQDVAALASQLDPEKLRRWLLDPKTPNHCLSLYSYLLGACGKAEDIALLKNLALKPPDARYAGALDGIMAGVLAGVHRQDAAEVWNLARTILVDKQRSFTERYGVLRFLRFQYEVDNAVNRKQIIACVDQMIDLPDMIDLAIGQLRTWKCWDQQERIFKLFDSPVAEAPITRSAVVKFALKCPSDEAKQFIARARLKDAKLVQDVEESLELFEKP